MSQTVLISGARAPVALEMARAFFKHGCKVVLVDSIHLPLARWSNAVFRYYKVPPPATDAARFAKRIQEIILSENVDHFIPTCEEAFYVSMFKSIFSCKVWASEIELMDKLHNKKSFISFCAPWFQTPATTAASLFSDWNNTRSYVFKPEYSRFATSAIIGKSLEICEPVKKNPEGWIVQKKIAGKEICIYSVWDEGRLKAICAYHPLYRVGQGSGIYFEPWYDAQLFEQVEKFGSAIQYTGQLCFDVIVNEEGSFVLECNPRGTSGAHLLRGLLANAFLDSEKIAAPGKQTFSIKYALVLLKPWLLFTSKFYRSIDVIFSMNDPLPFLLQPLSLLEITFKKIKERKGWLAATTADIEWNGHEN